MRAALALSIALASSTARAQDDPEAQTPDIAADAHTFPPEEEPAPVLEVNGRLHTRWTRTMQDPEHPSGDLTLAHARLQLTWHPGDRVEGQLGADFAPALSGSATTSGLIPDPLDAFVAARATRWLTLRAGHRKVPFSGQRLVSLGDLRPVRRGEYVGFLSTDDPANLTSTSLEYAGRKVGFDTMFEFRRLARLRLDLGFSQGDRGAADPAARASVRILGGLRLAGAVAALRTPDALAGERFWAVAYEADLLFERRRWRGELEVATGENWIDLDRRPFRGGTALVAYEIPLGRANQPSIEPLLRAEVLNRTVGGGCDRVLGLTAGATFRALEVLRLQANFEHLDWPTCATDEKDASRVFVQVAFDV